MTPTTTMNEIANTVTIDWSEPINNGAPIISYKILIRTADLETYLEDPFNCDGSQLVVMASRQCVISVQRLMSAPYSLLKDTSVFVRVLALNVMG